MRDRANGSEAVKNVRIYHQNCYAYNMFCYIESPKTFIHNANCVHGVDMQFSFSLSSSSSFGFEFQHSDSDSDLIKLIFNRFYLRLLAKFQL